MSNRVKAMRKAQALATNQVRFFACCPAILGQLKKFPIILCVYAAREKSMVSALGSRGHLIMQGNSLDMYDLIDSLLSTIVKQDIFAPCRANAANTYK